MFSYDQVLPIGTVVMLHGATRKMMIVGYQRMLANKDDDTIYDYCGCAYPEGFVSPEDTAVFNHEQIDRVFSLGLQNDEEKVFQEKLRTAIRGRKQ